MNIPTTPGGIERLATHRAKAKLGWYTHALVYLVVNTFLFLLSSYSPGHRPWVIYPALGWGLGLALHGISVFVLGTGSDLRERMIQKERDRLQSHRQS